MGLRDIIATLPPGFKFYPSDEELVCHYLYKKIVNEQLLKGTLIEIDLHTCEPWQLPEVAKLNASEWYFFSFRDRKYATGHRANRATTSGYWKATGKDRMVVNQRTGTMVGMRKTLVFYKSRAPNGIKTGWVMHEFRLENPHVPPKEDWVLCRVYHKAKSENNNELGSQSMSETNTFLNLVTTPLTQTIPCSYHLLSTFSQSPLYQKQYPNYPQLPRGSNEAPFTEMVNPTYEDDECGFFFDKTFKESSLEHGLPKNLEEVRFDDDNLVFL